MSVTKDNIPLPLDGSYIELRGVSLINGPIMIQNQGAPIRVVYGGTQPEAFQTRKGLVLETNSILNIINETVIWVGIRYPRGSSQIHISETLIEQTIDSVVDSTDGLV